VGILVADIDRSLDFYCGVLGLKLVKLFEMHSNIVQHVYGIPGVTVRMALIRCGWGSFIELIEYTPKEPKPPVPRTQPMMTHIALDVRNIKKISRELTERGVELLDEPAREGNTEFSFVLDPDGHLVEFIDMKLLYLANKLLGGVIGWLNMRGKYHRYRSGN
jgi:catechol 2,3-dioxygenase-like lactoylglutathione lyase family enzyme